MDCSQVPGPEFAFFVTSRQALAVLKGLDRTPYVGRRWPRMAALRVESVRGHRYPAGRTERRSTAGPVLHVVADRKYGV